MADSFDINSVIDVDDPANNDRLFPADKGRGHDPDQVDHSMHAAPSEIVLIPRTEWDARLEEQEKTHSSLMHVGAKVPVLDQGQVGYCWAHSTTGGAMFVRAQMHLPPTPLSAYAIAATIKKGRDEGGWCGLSAKFAREKGIPTQTVWPQGDRNYTKHDTPETWASAALHKVTDDFADLTKSEYDQNLTFDMVATCLLLNIPCAVDFNWWSHSVCAVRLVRVEAGSYGLEIRNSWGESWENKGNGILRGNKAIPDGAIAFRQVIVAPN